MEFEITKKDFQYYERIGVNIPTFCPNCRQQRRLSFRNERKLFRRKCDLCNQTTISIYQHDAIHPVYCQKCWWSDKNNPLEKGMDYDFKKPFFDQFGELLKTVQRPAIFNRNSENSDYTNICEDNKNCYLIVESSTNEDCLYCYWIQNSMNCIDCSYCNKCDQCYECDNCRGCYYLEFSYNCQNCQESRFLKNCKGCKNCFSCANLHQKQFCIFNEQYTKEEYEDKMRAFEECGYSVLEEMKINFNQWKKEQICKHAENYASENCTGDYIVHSKNCHECFCASEAWDCRYSYNVWRDSKDNMDVDTSGMNSELNYECINTAINSSNNIGCARCWGVRDSFYCNECDYSEHLFGCIGLRRKKYCILNKQYLEEKYKELKREIIKQMKQTNKFGEFFPSSISPFGYNESVANEFFPLSKEQALSFGFNWREIDDRIPDVSELINADNLSEQIIEIPDDILNWAIKCKSTNRPFKIVEKELQFYRDHKLPIPRLHPDVRHRDRMNIRNDRKLWSRKCSKCKNIIHSTYSQERPETVYCERCYLSEVY